MSPDREPFDGLITSFRRSLTAQRKSPKTIRGYVTTAERFAEFLREQGRPDDVHEVRRADIEDFLVDVGERASASTVATYFAHLQQFWRWLVDVEEEVDVSPMASMSRPQVGEPVVPDIPVDDLRALLKACAGNGYDERRDTAMIRVLLDTGVRVGELVGMTTEGLDLDGGRILVHGKGDRWRWVAFGTKATQALDRYLRARKRHSDAGSDLLWLGRRGAMTESGVSQMLRRRTKQAGIDHINPHRFRHTFSHRFLADGGSESDLMALTGWRSAEMVRRYGRSAAAERAIEAAHRHAPGDSI